MKAHVESSYQSSTFKQINDLKQASHLQGSKRPKENAHKPFFVITNNYQERKHKLAFLSIKNLKKVGSLEVILNT